MPSLSSPYKRQIPVTDDVERTESGEHTDPTEGLPGVAERLLQEHGEGEGPRARERREHGEADEHAREPGRVLLVEGQPEVDHREERGHHRQREDDVV